MTVNSPSETARGNFGIYDLDRKLITLIGDVQLDARRIADQRLAAGDRPRHGPRGGRRRRAGRRPERRPGHRPLHRSPEEPLMNDAPVESTRPAPLRRDRAASHDAATCAGSKCARSPRAYDRRAVLHDVSLSVARGEVVGLLGPNGAGKTTCFYSVMGLVKPDCGRIFLDGEDITGCRCTAARSSASAICRRKPRSSAG